MTDAPRDADAADPAPEGAESRETRASGAAGTGLFDLETLWRLVEDALPPAAADPFVGTVVGGVRLVRVVGEGGMGRVYEGLQEHPRRTVAVKLQRPGRMDRESTKRFLRELAILGRLSHPSLCHVYHAGFLPCGGERLPWFVMEFVADALPITRFAEGHALPLRCRVELFRDVCAGVAAAHAAGVVHRDIKAGNILVGGDGLPKLIDFGVATAFRGDLHATRLTRHGQIVGTIESIAPELLDMPPPAESPRTDVWSLGVVLHELVTGSSPFRSFEGSVVAAMQRIRAHRPALAARAAPGVGRALGRIVDKALAPAAADRHADADALARDLSALLDRFPERDSGWTTGGHVPLSVARPRRSRWLAPAIAAVGLSAAVPWITMPRRGAPVVEGGRPSVPIESSGRPPSESPGLLQSPIEQPDFRHAVRDVDDPEAERYLVESAGMRKWHEDFGRRFSYWGPAAFGVEGRLVFRYDFPRPSRRIYLRTGISCMGQRLEEGVIGSGACALEYSRDGHDWRCLVNQLEPRIWGAGMLFDELLPEAACGGRSLWLRMRLLADGPWKESDYTVAQFLRNNIGDPEPRFELVVECMPADAGLERDE